MITFIVIAGAWFLMIMLMVFSLAAAAARPPCNPETYSSPKSLLNPAEEFESSIVNNRTEEHFGDEGRIPSPQ
jgi:hypothetical protein